MGGGKECEASTHFIENSTFSHAAHVTKNRHNRMVCSQEAKVTEKSDAHNSPVRFVTKDPRTLPQASGALVPIQSTPHLTSSTCHLIFSITSDTLMKII